MGLARVVGTRGATGFVTAGFIGLVALAAAACTAPPGRTIVLVVIDALRADHLGTYGYGRATSPRIDEWASRGLVFEHAYTTAPWTLPAFGSMLTGRLPAGHSAGIETRDEARNVRAETVAARHFVTLSPEVVTLAELLGAAGFRTGAYVTNPFLHPRFELDRGFDDYDHYDTSNAELRRADVVVDEALRWIDRSSGPSFLLVHIFDPHLDYDAPPPFRGRFTAEGDQGSDLELPVRGLWPIRNRIAEMSPVERAFIVDAYDEEIAFVDEQVGRLLDGIEERQLLDGSLVILTSDHGEELFDREGFEHGHSMHEEVLRVPLMMWGRGVAAARRSSAVSLIDLAPTILEAAGVEAPGDLPGRALLAGDGASGAATGAPRATDPPVVAETPLYGPDQKAIIKWPYKAIVRLDNGVAQLFDLSVDPGERTDLADRQPDRLRALLGELAPILAEARRTGVAVQAELDEDLLRRLRALGYIR